MYNLFIRKGKNEVYKKGDVTFNKCKVTVKICLSLK